MEKKDENFVGRGLKDLTVFVEHHSWSMVENIPKVFAYSHEEISVNVLNLVFDQ